MKLTQEQIEEIRKRTEAATPGPWESSEFSGNVLSANDDEVFVAKGYSGDVYIDAYDEDIDFIVNARQDIPALLDYIRYIVNEVDKRDERIAEVEAEAVYRRMQAEDYREKGKRLFDERNMWKGLRLEAGGRLGEVVPKIAELETIAKDYAKLSRLFLQVTNEYLKSDKYDSEVKNFAQYINDCVADGNPVLGGVYDA